MTDRMTDEAPERPDAFPTRGGGEPVDGVGEPTTAGERLDEERLAEGGGVPLVDALDAGERGAPTHTLGQGAGTGPGTGAHFSGQAGGEGARAADLREHAQDLAEGEDSPAGGGPSGGTPEGASPG